MLKTKLTALKNFILQKNPYFNEGLELAYNKPEGEIFLGDERGNYFYLRLPNDITLALDSRYSMAEGVTPLIARVNIILVAYVQLGDEGIVLLNLINTLLGFNEGEIAMGKAIYKAETVITQELTGYDQDVINQALSTIDNAALVKLEFTLISPITLNYCILNPCKEC